MCSSDLHSRDIKMIKDDQGGTRNPYKCMNVMNKDTMDDKIKERCIKCENKSHNKKNVMLIDSKHTHTH